MRPKHFARNGREEQGRSFDDYITSQATRTPDHRRCIQARSGHDIFAFLSWLPSDHADRLEPVDDIMAELIKSTARSIRRWSTWPQQRPLGRRAGMWQSIKGPLAHRPDEGACRHRLGGDVFGRSSPAHNWTLDVMLKAAEATRVVTHSASDWADRR
jgi:hypothetical protein